MRARATRTGAVSFGLVCIPFRLFPAQGRSRSVAMRRLHTCGASLRGGGTMMFCPQCNVVAERAETLRGVEYARDQYVRFTDAEIKALETRRTDGLEIVEVVPADSVTVLHVRRTEIMGPGRGGDRAYALLRDALCRAGCVAIGRFDAGGDSKLVALRPHGRHLLMHELFYADQMRSLDDVETAATIAVTPLERELADALLEQLRRPAYDHARYRNVRADRVSEAVESKRARSSEGSRKSAAKRVSMHGGHVIDMRGRLRDLARREGA